VTPLVSSPTVARIVSGPRPVTVAGQVWSPDTTTATGGTAWTSADTIAGTTTQALYQPERYGQTGYAIPVPAVSYYRVTLHAAEVYFHAAGQRVFSVTAEGRTVLSDVDIFNAVGADTAYDASFTVRVSDGVLNLGLSAKVNNAKVSSLQVDRVAAMSPTVVSGTAPAAPTVTGPGPVTGTAPTLDATTFGTPFVGDPLSPRGGPFGATSVWRQSIRTAPTASNSSALVANLANQASSLYGGSAAFNNSAYGETFYTVGAAQQRVDVHWDDCQHKGYNPPGLIGIGGQLSSVPIPSDAKPSSGTDHYLSIYQPATDTMWAFWVTVLRADGWHACWGGRMDHASTNPGWFTNGFGVSATGLAAQGGAVNIKDVQAGSINHALALQVISAASWTNISWPAQRSDGSSTAVDAIPEGTRFRLDPNLNVDALHLTPVATMIAKAAQTYGFIVTDRAGCVSIVAEDGGPAQAATGVNPWKAALGSVPSYSVMTGFPWASLQALPKDYGKP
jgi:hypothetical protein